MSESNGRKRIVVLGGGFAGVNTAKWLTKLARGRDDVEVELLSEENYFVFQPLLPEVAAGGIAATHVVNPIREMVPGARFRHCKILDVNVAEKHVHVSQGDGLEVVAVHYDHLVFCLGKVTSFRGMPGAAEHAFAMKDLGDAFRLRNHVIRCLENADVETDARRKRRLLTFVVAGGGFSGVETMGELQELVDRSLKYFPNVRREEVRYALIHSAEVLLPEMPATLGEAARAILERRGVEVFRKARVRAASASVVYLADGRSIETRTFVCTVGNAPNPIVADTLKAQVLAEHLRDGKGSGLFRVDRMLRCLSGDGSPVDGYWAVGDCAAIPSPKGEGLCPPTAQFAIREARACAANILASIDGAEPRPFAFEVLGMLASLGQRSAVAKILGVELTGFFAWFLWRTVYLMKLPGLVRRLRVMLDWTLDLFFPRDITQLQVFKSDRLRVDHYEPDEIILRRGEVGRELYMIVRGEVEVTTPRGAGKTELVLSRLGPKDVFGERALLEDTPRTATVRAVGPVDVLVMGRGDFRQLIEHMPVLADHFAAILKQRYPEDVGERPLLDCVRDHRPARYAAAPPA